MILREMLSWIQNTETEPKNEKSDKLMQMMIPMENMDILRTMMTMEKIYSNRMKNISRSMDWHLLMKKISFNSLKMLSDWKD